MFDTEDLKKILDPDSLMVLADARFQHDHLKRSTEDLAVKYIRVFLSTMNSENETHVVHHHLRVFFYTLQKFLGRIPFRDHDSFFYYLFVKRTQGSLHGETTRRFEALKSQSWYIDAINSTAYKSPDSTSAVLSWCSLQRSNLPNMMSDSLRHLTFSAVRFNKLALFEPSCQYKGRSTHTHETCYSHTINFFNAIASLRQLEVLDLSTNQYGHYNKCPDDALRKSHDLGDRFRKTLQCISSLQELILRNNMLCDEDFWELLFEYPDKKAAFAFREAATFRSFDFSVNFLSFSSFTGTRKNLFALLRDHGVKIEVSANYTRYYEPDESGAVISSLDKRHIRDIFHSQPLHVESLLEPRIIISPNSWCALTSYEVTYQHTANLSETMSPKGELALTIYDALFSPAQTSEGKKSTLKQIKINPKDALKFALMRNRLYRTSASLWTLTEPDEIEAMHGRYKDEEGGDEKESGSLSVCSSGFFRDNCFDDAKKKMRVLEKGIKTDNIPANNLHTKLSPYASRVSFPIT